MSYTESIPPPPPPEARLPGQMRSEAGTHLYIRSWSLDPRRDGIVAVVADAAGGVHLLLAELLHPFLRGQPQRLLPEPQPVHQIVPFVRANIDKDAGLFRVGLMELGEPCLVGAL